jgi:hypothetical protein
MNRILAAGRMRITNPNYISQQMFDVALRQKFLENPDDDAVTQQALTACGATDHFPSPSSIER